MRVSPRPSCSSIEKEESARSLTPQKLSCSFFTCNNTEHVQGLGANGKAAFSPKAHG